MSIQTLRNVSVRGAPPVRRTRIASTGTHALGFTMEQGIFYKVTTDTTQSLNATQFTLLSDDGYKVGAVIRGGLGYIAPPFSSASVSLTAGTYPMVLEFEELEYSLIEAPVITGMDFTSLGSPYTFDLTYTAPANATSIGIYWPNGTFVDTTSTSGSYSGTTPTTPTFGDPYPFLLAAKDANGVWGAAATSSTAYPFTTFTTSGTFVTPSGVNAVDLVLVGGGGCGGGAFRSGGNSNNIVGKGGGGGAGEVVTLTSASVSGSVTVTIGAGGVAANDTSGGTTFFGSASAVGGGRGATYASVFAAVGAGGGGGAGISNSDSAPNYKIGANGNLFAGGTGTFRSGMLNGTAGGGGGNNSVGGDGSNAANSNVGNSGGNGGTGTTVYGAILGVGGTGGGTGTGSGGGNAANGSTYGGGGGGGRATINLNTGQVAIGPGADGNSGYVIVKTL